MCVFVWRGVFVVLCIVGWLFCVFVLFGWLFACLFVKSFGCLVVWLFGCLVWCCCIVCCGVCVLVLFCVCLGVVLSLLVGCLLVCLFMCFGCLIGWSVGRLFGLFCVFVWFGVCWLLACVFELGRVGMLFDCLIVCVVSFGVVLCGFVVCLAWPGMA